MKKYIYLDESGDLGINSEKSSKTFVIALLITADNLSLARCVKKTRQKMHKQMSAIPELKAFKSDEKTRNRLLNEFSKTNSDIHYIVLDKLKNKGLFKEHKHKLYNYIAASIVNEIHLVSSDKIELVVDRRKLKLIEKEEFDKQVLQAFSGSKTNVRISHRDSCSCKELQVVDFIAWSIFRKYELKDEEYYSKIANKIKTSKRI